MRKYRTFIAFLALVLLWSFFFGALKFYTWSFFSDTLSLKLEQIAGAMSFGGIAAYLIGGVFAALFSKRSILFIIALGAFFSVCALYFFGITSTIGALTIIGCIGGMYSFWAITKNALIFVETNKTGKTDTFVNGAVGICLIITLLGGSVVGPKMFELFGKTGSLIVLIPMIVASLVALFLGYSKEEDVRPIIPGKGVYGTFKELFLSYLKNAASLFKTYWMMLLCISVLWGVSTIVAQQSIELSIEKFAKTESEAAFIFLYSGIGAIIGNAISMFIKKNRWLFFRLFAYSFAALIFFFPLLTSSFPVTIMLAIIVSILFGGASNLTDAYYFYEIGALGKKEHGSGLYGLIMAIIIAVLMFGVTSLLPLIGRVNLFYVLGVLLAGTGLLVRINLKKLNIPQS